MAAERDEGPLGRWSRRKRARRREDEAAAGAPGEEETAGEDEAAVDPAELPDIDSLDKDSDYAPFFRKGVPEELRNKALRKLWRSDPLLANLDGLNNYDEDFRKPFLDAGRRAVRTLYEAGRGWAGAAEREEAGARAASRDTPGADPEAAAEPAESPPAAAAPEDADARSEEGAPATAAPPPKGRARTRRWGLAEAPDPEGESTS